MRFSVWPNAAQPWSEILGVAQHAEATGWDGVWIADHFMPNAADVSGPVHEAGPLPLLLGGGGERVTLRLAAKWADEWNTWGTPEIMRHKNGVLDERCKEIDRDPATIARSTQALLFMSDDEAWLQQRRDAQLPM